MSGDVAGIIRISAAAASSPVIYIDVWKTRWVGACDLVSQQGSVNGPTNSTPCWDNSSCNSPHGLWEQQIHWNFLVALYRYHIGYRPIWEIFLIYWDTGYMHLIFNVSVGVAICNLNVRGFRCRSPLVILGVQKQFVTLLDIAKWFFFYHYFHLLSSS